MKWLICGTIPDSNFPLRRDEWTINRKERVLESYACANLEENKKISLSIERGTPALLASALYYIDRIVNEDEKFNYKRDEISLQSLLVGDIGDGLGSKALYNYLSQLLLEEDFVGITFHYLFPDLEGHNKIVLALENRKRPLLIADAGFMYVAKMSGYADMYDVFTPDIGEMAFLADEHAPHPFYTRGFLLADEKDIPSLLEKARQHKNIARHLIIKGHTDYIVEEGEIMSTIEYPSVPAMEAIGGTGDLVTGLVTAKIFLAKVSEREEILNEKVEKEGKEESLSEILKNSALFARELAQKAQPNPASQISEILEYI